MSNIFTNSSNQNLKIPKLTHKIDVKYAKKKPEEKPIGPSTDPLPSLDKDPENPNFNSENYSLNNIEILKFQFEIINYKEIYKYISFYLILIFILLYILTILKDFQNIFYPNNSTLIFFGSLIKFNSIFDFWRLFTNLFLTSNLFNLILNLILIFYFLIGFEKNIGKLKFLIIIFFSSFLGNLFYFFTNNLILVGSQTLILSALGYYYGLIIKNINLIQLNNEFILFLFITLLFFILSSLSINVNILNNFFSFLIGFLLINIY